MNLTRCLQLVFAILMSLVLQGCTKKAEAPGEGGPGKGAPGRLRFGMLPKLVGIPYFNACRKGAEEAAKELGVDLEYNGPLTADVGRQIEIVSSWILQGLDAVLAAPNNPEAIAPVLRKARGRGVRVVTWDTDSQADARECFCNQVGYNAMAQTLVNIISEEIGGKGRVALISGTETAANQNTWMGIMRRYAAEKHPGVTFIDPVEYPGEDDARAYQSAQGLLRSPDPPAGIIGMTTVSAPAAAKAVFDAKLSGKVAVTGITLPSSMRPYVKNGTVRRFVLWSPNDFGYLTIYAAKRLIEGKLLEGPVEMGRLGKLEFKAGEIVLGPPLVFDASNVDKYDF